MAELVKPNQEPSPMPRASNTTRSVLLDAAVVASGFTVNTDVHHVFLSLLCQDAFTRDVFSARSNKDLGGLISTVKACIPTKPIDKNSHQNPEKMTEELLQVLSDASRFAKSEKLPAYEPRHVLKAIINQTPINYYVHLAVSRSMDMLRLPGDFARRERREMH